MQQPIKHPGSEAISQALRVLSDYVLHYYQLLYFQTPKLTQPGKGGYPFEVALDPEHMACVNFIPQQNKDYTFSVRSFDGAKDQDACDQEVLAKCKMVLEHIKEKKEKADRRMCCPMAERRSCVCVYSYKCALHGTHCIGSHD